MIDPVGTLSGRHQYIEKRRAVIVDIAEEDIALLVDTRRDVAELTGEFQ